MKNQFKITGRYYTINNYKFRDVLNIKKQNTKLQAPDIMVLMLNPGGSKPKNGDDENGLETEAVPDRTQNQIMKVMLNSNFEYARVLNLSDYREAKSPIFYDKINELESQGVPHSIFDDSRTKDFNKLWVNNVPVIFGWGVHSNLNALALKAIDVCKVQNPYGILKPNTNWAYYHPLPPIYIKQVEWVNEITDQFNK